MNSANENKSRLKKAEILNGVGALVLGIGLGVLLSGLLKPYALPVLFIGLLMHAFGMFDKHRLESESANTRLWWSEFLYWVCWIALIGVIIYIAAGFLRG